MSVNAALLSNSSVWTGKTTTIPYTSGGIGETLLAFTLMEGVTPAGEARSAIISNTGPVNIFVNSNVSLTTGILLQPGASLHLGVGSGATAYAYDAVGTATWSLVLFE